jgi:hypothetical protein
MPDYVARILRTMAQLLAAGGFTALFEQVAKDVPASYTPYVLLVSMLLVTIAQNVLEQATGKEFLKPASADTAHV